MINDDEVLITATIPEAAGKPVTITTFLRTVSMRSQSPTRFDDDGRLVSDHEYGVGAILPSGKSQIFTKSRMTAEAVQLAYKFSFDDSDVQDFAVRAPGVGGGVVDVACLQHWDGDRGPITGENVEVTVNDDGETLYDGMTMTEIRELIDQLVEERVAAIAEATQAQAFDHTRQQIQEVLDAMNGPNATVDSVRDMFWLLNDLVEALIEATGVKYPS
jgi:hypothetical protein